MYHVMYDNVCIHVLTIQMICLCMNAIALIVSDCPENSGCEQVCEVTGNSFECRCQSGYQLHSNGKNCTG